MNTPPRSIKEFTFFMHDYCLTSKLISPNVNKEILLEKTTELMLIFQTELQKYEVQRRFTKI